MKASPQDQPAVQKVTELILRLQERAGTAGVGDIPPEKFKYAIYVRRSSNDKTKNKQLYSITDQLRECRKLASDEGLRVAEVFAEKQSAKISDKRPLFRAMLDNLKAGKYHGIIAWAPDRLARNMKEGGELIDMLDHGHIRDMRFANHFTFSNDPSGKMLLGIAFIMAKQFSDAHGQNIVRTNTNKTRIGKWAGSKQKQGYYKDRNHYLRPDGENHELIRAVFQWRLAGRQMKDIAAYLVERGYPVTTAHTAHRDIQINEKFISDVLRDKTYVGALKFADTYVNLLEQYDFVPAVSYEDFERIHNNDGDGADFELARVFDARPEKKAKLMNGMIICGHCQKPMYPSITTKPKKDGTKTNYYFFDCKRPDCGKEEIRAKDVLEGAYAFLDKHPLGTQAGYAHYVEEMTRLAAERAQEEKGELKSLVARKNATDRRREENKDLLRGETDADLRREFKRDVQKDVAASQELAEKIKTLKKAKDASIDAMASMEEFVELFRNIANLARKIDSMADLDYIMRKLFTNLTVKGGKIIHITQNSPFRELCASENDVDCGLVNQVRRNWKPIFAQLLEFSEFVAA